MRASSLFKVETEKEDIPEYSAVFAEKLKGWESKTDKIFIGHIDFDEFVHIFATMPNYEKQSRIISYIF